MESKMKIIVRKAIRQGVEAKLTIGSMSHTGHGPDKAAALEDLMRICAQVGRSGELDDYQVVDMDTARR